MHATRTDDNFPFASIDPAQNATARPSGTRYAEGLRALQAVGGSDYDIQLKRLGELAPDLARLTVEFAYGDLVARPGLDLPHRELATVAALIALGSAQPQVKYHMHGFLNVGGKPEELVELLILSVAFAGFPAAIDAVGIVREVFGERAIAVDPVAAIPANLRDRLAAGVDCLAAGGVPPGLDDAALLAAAPEWARWTVEFAYGDILARRVLSEKQKELAAISMLAAAGNRSAALRFHLQTASQGALERGEIVEALMQLAAYAGFPAALNALFVAGEVFAATGESFSAPHFALREAIAQTRVAAVHTDAQRRERGLQTLAATSGAAGETVVRGFDDVAPLLGQLLVEHAAGDVFSRPGIDARTRELSAISALAAVGSKTCETPLRVHVTAALEVGATLGEIVEVLYNLLPYRGYPAVQHALAIAVDTARQRQAA